MNFYYRSLTDGKCEVVCTRCFMTIGAAREIHAIRHLENRHRCGTKRIAGTDRRSPARSPASVSRLMRAIERVNRSRALRNGFLLVAVALLLYILPTLVEFAVVHRWNPWITALWPGDLAGCACMIVVFRRVKEGIALYCLLTVIKSCLYSFHVTPMIALLWISDTVPSLIVAAMVLRLPPRSAKLITIP